MRKQEDQDAMRLTFISTNILNAHFLVVGGSSSSIAKLFDTPHPKAVVQESRRQAFARLFSRDMGNPRGEATFAVWLNEFPGASDRIPGTVFSNFQGKLKTELMAMAEARVGGAVRGFVFVWQCNRTKGPAN